MQKAECVQIHAAKSGMVRLMFNGRVVGFVADIKFARQRANELERDVSRLYQLTQRG